MDKKCSNFRFCLIFFLPALFLTLSCGDKEKGDYVYPLAPTISSISPEKGKPGEIITIRGNGFGVDKFKVKVKFNDINVTTLISVIDTEIKVKVPAGFLEEVVDVTVFVNDLASNQKTFTYVNPLTPPSITSMTATCFYGSTVVILGANFSPNKEENIVRFGDIEATIIETKSTSLTVITPDLGNAIAANVTVTRLDMVSLPWKIDVDLDQNKIATYDWTTHTVKPGVVYKTGQFTLFGSITRRVHVLDVTLDGENTLGIGFSTTNKSTVSMCNDYDAVAGINAGYFPMSGASDKDPYIRINGVTVQNGHLGVSQIFTNSVLLIHENVATVRKFTENSTNLNQVAAAIPVSQAQSVIVCGPMLITNGRLDDQNMNSSHNSSSTARTGLGITTDGKRVFMVVVDYNQGATGVQTPQLAKILQALGAYNAMNFDGGGSSTMFVKDQGDNGRVSINTYSQRSIRSVIYVK